MSELLPDEIPDELLQESEPVADPIDPADTADSIEPADPADPDRLVPMWLAGLVLVLLLAVMALGGYAIRGIFADPPTNSSRDLDVEKWEGEVKLTPDDNEARLNLGFAYQQAKRYEEALEQYETVLETAPQETAALYNTGIVYQQLDREGEAEGIWWDVLEIDPEHVLAAKALGEYYAERREYRSLLEAVRPVVEVNESSADLQYLTGLAYENLGRRDWAKARYELALTYYPDMAEAREGLERLGAEQ